MVSEVEPQLLRATMQHPMKSIRGEPGTPRSVISSRRDAAAANMEDPDGMLASVARSIEQLRGAAFSPQDKEAASGKLVELVRDEERRSGAIKAITSHSQAIPLLVNLLRTGTLPARTNVAELLALICAGEELRIKLLLGGCIPPLLTLLSSDSLSAARALHSLTSTLDHVAAKIFSTEGVVPSLWRQFRPGNRLDVALLPLLTGALRNLCCATIPVSGFWPATRAAGGVDVLLALLSASSPEAQADACAILTSLLDSFPEDTSDADRLLLAGAAQQLFNLLPNSPTHTPSLRAEAAGVLRALTRNSASARSTVSASPVLVRSLVKAVVAPSREFMQGVFARQLQENAMGALANVLGGMSTVVARLSNELRSNSGAPSDHIHDTVGALAYALMVTTEEEDEAAELEKLLVKLTTAHGDDQLLEEHAIEALASLYGNAHIAPLLEHAEAKKMLVGVATMADPWVRVELVNSLANLCGGKTGLWDSIRGRDGVQFLISLLGVSSEQQQEYAVALLSILSRQIDESNWAITASGGIPPLVQLLETGSTKARQDSAIVLSNLCSHSEDIRACVETAQAEAALLWLLKNAGAEGQEIAATAIVQLVKAPDADTLTQLTAMLVSEMPASKQHVLEVLKALLTLVSKEDMLQEGQGDAAHEAFVTLISLLAPEASLAGETQEKATSVVADLLTARPDLHGSPLVRDHGVGPLIKLLSKQQQEEEVRIAAQGARALGALFTSIRELEYVRGVARDAIAPLLELAKASNLAAAEAAVGALANLLLDSVVALEVPIDAVIAPVTTILKQGSEGGRHSAAATLAPLVSAHEIDDRLVEGIRSSGTIFALAQLLTDAKFEQLSSSQPLEALLAIARRARSGVDSSRELLRIIADQEHCVAPLVTCISSGPVELCDKAIEVVARICEEQPVLTSDLMASTSECIPTVAQRIIGSDNAEVKVGGTSLLVCAARQKHKEQALSELGGSALIHTLVTMLSSPEAEAVSLWLLSAIAAHDSASKVGITEAGAIDILADKLAVFAPNARQAKVEESGSNWISAMLLAILFQERDVSRASATSRAVPALSMLLKSDHTPDRYFSAQALASLVCHGSRGTLLAVATSGAVSGLIALLGSSEVGAANLVALSEEFLLVPNPEQIALERLFRVEDIRCGATARKAIPALVELLKPNPGRPGAAPLALSLLAQIAEANTTNRMIMAEAGALEGLTKYLSLGPQDAIEEAAAELLRILFSSPELRRHESAPGAVDQLIAVLRMGARGSRYTAARALEGVFCAEQIRGGDMATQAIVPLVEMLHAAVEREQRAAMGALISLATDNPHKAILIGDAELSTLEVVSKLLSSESSSVQLKEQAAELCSVLFANARVRSKPAATGCIPPLVDLLSSDVEAVQYLATRALDNVLDDEQQAEAVAAYGAVVPLVESITGSCYKVHEASVSALIKLGKDRPLCKLDMVKAGVIDNILSISSQPGAPDSLCALSAELLRIVTNNSSIARSSSASRAVEPLFCLLASRGEALGAAGQHSAVQTLVNIMEKPQSVAVLNNLSCGQALQPLVELLYSSSQSVQQVAAELLSHLLPEPRFHQDASAQAAIPALIKLIASSGGAVSVQQRAVAALELAVSGREEAVVELDGVGEMSKILMQVDPPAPHALWESAARLLANVLQWSSSHADSDTGAHLMICHPTVIAKLLRSSNEATVSTAIHALLLVEKEDASTGELIADAGGIESLVEILRCHQCEESAARLLESLVNNVKVRSMKAAKLAIGPLSEFLMDPHTQSEQARLLAALALGDLFQNDVLCKSTDAVSACRALVSLLEGPHGQEIQTVAICALQNLVVSSRPNKRAVAEAGGVQALQDLVNASTPEIAVQAAALIRMLFANYTIQEFANVEVVQSLLALLEKDLWSREPVKDEIVRSINVLFGQYSKFRTPEIATGCIPLMIATLKSESEVAQEAALDTLFLFTQTWSAISEEECRAQANAMADAIPLLQMLARNGPQRFHERIELLLHCLPGNLLVNIKRASNLKGGTNAFCKITLGNGPPRQTRVVSNNNAPQWEQGFAWAFDTPPKGQKLHISCKNKGAFGKASLGKVTIQIDRVVLLGTLCGEYQLSSNHSKDGTPRTLEVEFQWSNR